MNANRIGFASSSLLTDLAGRGKSITWVTFRRHQPAQSPNTMSDSPPYRPPSHSVSCPVPLRSALKHRDSSSSRPSPPTSPPLPISPAPHISLSLSSALPSPMVSGGYTPKVSFDTFENPAASMFSFTLCAESVGYARTPQTRVFLCAASPDESGRQALDWALDSLVQDGDELVVFRGFDEDDLGVFCYYSFRRSYAVEWILVVVCRPCADIRCSAI